MPTEPATTASGDARTYRELDPLAAVFFDMDGLLVDTEHDWFAVETEVMASLGAPWGPEHQAALVGGPMEHSVRYMIAQAERHGGADISEALLTEWLVTGMAARLRTDVRERPGARALLLALAEVDIPTVLVSASFRVLVDAVLEWVGPGLFAFSVAGDEVPLTKPDPAPYLKAATLLDVDPASCAVLEDSLPGLASAEAAGCVSIGVPNVLHLPPAPGRTVVGSLVDLTPASIAHLVRLAQAH